MLETTHPHHRPIRTFMPRQSRTTPAQKQAFETQALLYCLDPTVNFDAQTVFGNSAPVVIEIGFGNGDSLVQMAKENPQLNYVGIEVHRPGVGHLMRLLAEQQISNVKLYNYDALDILAQRIPNHSLAGVHLFFPDPWQKRKHHKRRIVKPSFTALLTKKLQSGGYFHAATDWEHYANDMLSILNAEHGLINTSKTKTFCERPDYRPLTKFEKRGLNLGHGMWDLIFKKS